MPREKKHSPEAIMAKLRQAEVLDGQGATSVVDAVRSIEATEPIHHRRRQEFGGLRLDQARGRLMELEAEDARLRRAATDLTFEELVLEEAASGNG